MLTTAWPGAGGPPPLPNLPTPTATAEARGGPHAAAAEAGAAPTIDGATAADDASARVGRIVAEPIGQPPRPRPTLPTGHLRGRVLDALRRPVGNTTVRALCMQDLELDHRTSTAGDGTFAFADLRIGHYRVFVEPGELRGNRRADDRSSTRTRLTAGADLDVGDLVVACDAIVEGVVVTAANVGIEAAVARIVPMPMGDAVNAPTDALGHFRTGPLKPGRYRANVDLRTAAPPHSSLAAPHPVFFEVRPDSLCALEPLVCGAGTAKAHGRVVDERGQPVDGLDVICTGARTEMWREQRVVVDQCDGTCVLLRARTDAKGDYHFAGLPAGAVDVQIGGPYPHPIRPGQHPLAQPGPLLRAELAADADVDLGCASVLRSHPYRLEGRIEIDPAWAKAHQNPQLVVRIADAGREADRRAFAKVSSTPLPTLLARNSAGTGFPDEGIVPLRADGTFVFTCEATSDAQRRPRELWIRCRDSPEVAVHPITPKPDGDERATFRFPP